MDRRRFLKTSSVMRLQKMSSTPAHLFQEGCFHSETLSPSSASLFSPVFEPSCSRTGGEIGRSFLPVAAAALILNRCRLPASTGLDCSGSLFARGQANYALGRQRRRGTVGSKDASGCWAVMATGSARCPERDFPL